MAVLDELPPTVAPDIWNLLKKAYPDFTDTELSVLLSLIKREVVGQQESAQSVPATNVHFTFDGWTDESHRHQFYGSVDYLVQQAISGHTEPRTPPGLLGIWVKSDELDGVATPIGSRIRVLYLPHHITVEEISEFLRRCWARVRPHQ